MVKMAVSSVVILMVIFTSVVQVAGSFFPQLYPIHKTLESALITEETLFTMRQVFFPVEHSSTQETQQVHIIIHVEIIVDYSLNSTTSNSCIAIDSELIEADKNVSIENVSSLHWKFLWTDSALLSLITIDQLIAFDVFAGVIYNTAIGIYHIGDIEASLPIVCPAMPKRSEIKTSLMLLLSWSKSYARHQGVPPQWDKIDKGYIQELALNGSNLLAESKYNKNDVHLIRQGMIICFTLLNTLVLIGMLSYGKHYYMEVHRITSGPESARLVAVTWAFMITAFLVNSSYLIGTLYFLTSLKHLHPRFLTCVFSDPDWCDSVKSTKLYSDDAASLLVKLTVVPFTIVVELIIAVRLTSHTLLPFPCSMATRSHDQCCSFRIGKRVIQTILIWNVMVFIQIVFGVALLPVGILIVIAPVTTISVVSTMLLILIEFTGFFVYFILKWLNNNSFIKCCSLTLCANVFTAVVILSLSTITLLLYYFVSGLGVEPWSVKGSIFSLLPSFLVTPLLWFAKRYFFKKNRATEEVEHDVISMTVRNQSIARSENTREEEKEEKNVEEA